MNIQLRFCNKKETRIYLNYTYVNKDLGVCGLEKNIDFGYIVYSKKEYDYSNVKNVSVINFANADSIFVDLDIEKLKLELQKMAVARSCKIYDLAMTSKIIVL